MLECMLATRFIENMQLSAITHIQIGTKMFKLMSRQALVSMSIFWFLVGTY